jgi:hypothetical protein
VAHNEIVFQIKKFEVMITAVHNKRFSGWNVPRICNHFACDNYLILLQNILINAGK